MHETNHIFDLNHIYEVSFPYCKKVTLVLEIEMII